MNMDIGAPDPNQVPFEEIRRYMLEEAPGQQERLSFAQNLMQRGVGGAAAGMITDQIGTRAGRMRIGQAMAGDQYALGQLATDTTMQMDMVSLIRNGFDDSEAGEAMISLMQNLEPIIDPTTGLRVGIASVPGQTLDRWMRNAVLPTGGGMYADEIGGIAQRSGLRGLQAEQVSLQRGYQDFQFAQARRGIQWQEVSQFGGTHEGFSTRGTFAIQRELRNISRLFEEFQMDYQDQMRDLNRRQFMENWQVRADRLPVQFGRQREDLAFNAQGAALQYSWNQEDLQEQMRYATGRQRRQLMRQLSRTNISYARQTSQFNTQGERIDQNEQWAIEDMERQRRHYEERFALEQTYQDNYRQYHEQRRALEDEMQDIREHGARFQLNMARENLMAQEELAQRMRTIQNFQMGIQQGMQNAIALQTVFTRNLLEGLAGAVGLAQQLNQAINNRSYGAYGYGNQSDYDYSTHGGSNTIDVNEYDTWEEVWAAWEESQNSTPSGNQNPGVDQE
jgi:hypothetical protein